MLQTSKTFPRLGVFILCMLFFVGCTLEAFVSRYLATTIALLVGARFVFTLRN